MKKMPNTKENQTMNYVETHTEPSNIQFSIHKKHCQLRFKELIEKVYPIYRNSFMQLTTREKEILKYMALGTESRTIAEQLFISKHTVDTHRKNIYRKTELKTPRDIVLFTLLFNI